MMNWGQIRNESKYTCGSVSTETRKTKPSIQKRESSRNKNNEGYLLGSATSKLSKGYKAEQEEKQENNAKSKGVRNEG